MYNTTQIMHINMMYKYVSNRRNHYINNAIAIKCVFFIRTLKKRRNSKLMKNLAIDIMMFCNGRLRFININLRITH